MARTVRSSDWIPFSERDAIQAGTPGRSSSVTLRRTRCTGPGCWCSRMASIAALSHATAVAAATGNDAAAGGGDETKSSSPRWRQDRPQLLERTLERAASRSGSRASMAS
ncbi:Os09g0443050 [Oryza sativa Japonica Group]|uniref:Os09g0443050 protein n=1 Tax=Oryza sativa subsp. japonica TaxID=39947 RepID=A0A0P0XMQ4_ORYSJ|nr:Os09g0443050 [Oryza sativa Japonica Group]